VARTELDLADRLNAFAAAIARRDYTVPDASDVRGEAFSCAAWLQDLHPIMQEVMIEQEDVHNARASSDN
jgi:hypothetical protein